MNWPLSRASKQTKKKQTNKETKKETNANKEAQIQIRPRSGVGEAKKRLNDKKGKGVP